jgi:hypothetical protein
VGCAAVQDALDRGARYNPSRDSTVVAGGSCGAARAAGATGDSRRASLDTRANGGVQVGREGGAQELQSVATQMRCTAPSASSSPASPSRLLSPAAERARSASPWRASLDTRANGGVQVGREGGAQELQSVATQMRCTAPSASSSPASPSRLPSPAAERARSASPRRRRRALETRWG